MSINTPTIAVNPCSAGCFTCATACACGVEPIPASFENSPLATPFCTATLTTDPAIPPATALPVNALLNIHAIVGITSLWNIISITKLPAI